MLDLTQVVQKVVALEKRMSDSVKIGNRLAELEKKMSQAPLLNATHVAAASRDVEKLHEFVTRQIKELDTRDNQLEKAITDLRASVKALTAQVIKLGQK